MRNGDLGRPKNVSEVESGVLAHSPNTVEEAVSTVSGVWCQLSGVMEGQSRHAIFLTVRVTSRGYSEMMLASTRAAKTSSRLTCG